VRLTPRSEIDRLHSRPRGHEDRSRLAADCLP
jgi:hypothetical protein